MRGKDLNNDFAPKIRDVMKRTLRNYSFEFGLAFGPVKATPINSQKLAEENVR